MSDDARHNDRPHDPKRSTVVESEGFDPHGGRDIFFAAVATTRMPMAVADPRLPDVPIVFANAAFLEMTGYAREEVVGRNCRFLQGPETDRASVAKLRDALAQEREITVELLNYRKDGSAFWNALFLTPVRNAAGELIYYFSSQLDITRRHDAEAALRQSQKMEALGQLTGGIAHDFNNLLQVILGNLDVATVRARMLGVNDPVLDRAQKGARDAARKSGELTQQLLAFARKQQLQGRVLNLNDLVQAMAADAERSIGARIAVTTELAPDLWNARLDPTQAELAILNIFFNARDAMKGQGRLHLRTCNVQADDAGARMHGLPQPGRYVLVCLTDDGPGIPPEILPRVMDPFFTTKTAGAGTGLGLSMVYGFARQSGGTASLYSEPGQGTTVRLYFPATLDEADAAAPAPAAEKATAATARKVLVVDDRREVAELAAAMLQQMGHDATACLSPATALERLAAAQPPFDLLLTDLIMPGGMNGVLLAREAVRRQPGLDVLLMTGFADDSVERWGGEGFDMLFKPFTADDLARKLRGRPVQGRTSIA